MLIIILRLMNTFIHRLPLLMLLCISLLSCITNSSPIPQPQKRSTSSDLFSQQMRNPAEIFSILMLIGGESIKQAIAQLSGRKFTLLPFSFGWVPYTFGSLMSVTGDGVFMPPPDCSVSVTEVDSRIKKNNSSWVIGRLVRDLEGQIESSMETWENTSTGEDEIPRLSGEWDSGLLVSIFEVRPGAGIPKRDFLDWSFFITLSIQLGVATIPTVVHKEWSTMLLTVAGTAMAVATSSMREWRFEKFHCRKNSPHSYILTRGNGHRHVLVLLADKAQSGLYLDDLAGTVAHATRRTRIMSAVLTFLWIVFLLVAGGINSGHTWYLLVVGGIGMTQNVAVAGLSRETASHGVPLSEAKKTFGRRRKGKPKPRVMDVLYDVDNEYPGVGQAIQPEYFQDLALTPDEAEEWNRRRTKTRVKDESEGKGEGRWRSMNEACNSTVASREEAIPPTRPLMQQRA